MEKPWRKPVNILDKDANEKIARHGVEARELSRLESKTLEYRELLDEIMDLDGESYLEFRGLISAFIQTEDVRRFGKHERPEPRSSGAY